jgi:predicted phosphodiesterase
MKYFNHPWVRRIAVTLLVISGTLFSIQLFARTSFKYDSLSFDLRTRVCQTGGTVIAVPPVGRLFLKSHRTPWQLIITLNEVDFVKLEKQLNSLPSKQEWLQLIQKQILKAVGTLFTLVIFFGITGGALILMAFHIYPPSRTFWYGLLGSFLLAVLMISTTVLTYNPHAIERPQYEGVLASAPWAMNLITMGLDNIEVIGDNLKKISEGLPMLYKQAGQIKNMGDFQTDLAILHVSDIHNNPAAFDFIEQLAANFKIRLIIDTGDLTDYGTPLEAEIIQRIARIKTPYIFIPGNHDSPLIIQRLRKLRNVTVITGGLLRLGRVKLDIEGQADPASQNYSPDVASAEQITRSGELLAEKVSKLQKIPDLVAVHNRFQAEKLIGKVPLIICGHDHRYDLTIKENTVIDDAGTTGAAGLRGLDSNGVPYSATILYWKKDQQGKLKLHAADSIKINGLEGNLTIDRRTF